MNKVKIMIVSAFAVLGLGLVATPAYAAPCATSAECVKAGVTASGGKSSKTDIGGLIQTVVNVLLFLLGAIAVIMIVIGGIKYTTSNGDSSSVTSAKNTILYAVVGLIVALMAYAIVNFIIDKFV
jgi:hypothetical protein